MTRRGASTAHGDEPPHRKSSSVLSLVRSWAAYGALPAVGILTAPLLARALGPTGRGELAAILQPLTIAGAIAAIGVPAAVVYFQGKSADPARVRRIAWEIALVTTVAVGVVLVLYSKAISDNLGMDRIMILLIWSAFLPSVFIAIRRAEHQASRRYVTLDAERTSAALLRLGAIVLLFTLAATGVPAYALAYMASGLVASLLLLRSTRAGDRTTMTPAPSRAGFYRYAGLISVGTIAGAMNSRLDQAIMPALSTATDLGYYSVAVAVAEIPAIITLVVVRNVLAEASSGAPLRSIWRVILIGGGAVTIAAVALGLVAPWAVPLVFGGAFGVAAGATQVLLIATGLQFVADTVAVLLAGRGRPGLGSLGPVVATLVTIGTFALIGSGLTAMDAAWIAVVAQAFAVLAGLLAFAVAEHRRPDGRKNLDAGPNGIVGSS